MSVFTLKKSFLSFGKSLNLKPEANFWATMSDCFWKILQHEERIFKYSTLREFFNGVNKTCSFVVESLTCRRPIPSWKLRASPTSDSTNHLTKNRTTDPTKNPTRTPTPNLMKNPLSYRKTNKEPDILHTFEASNKRTASWSSNPTKHITSNPTIGATKQPMKNPTVDQTKNPTQPPAYNLTKTPTPLIQRTL